MKSHLLAILTIIAIASCSPKTVPVATITAPTKSPEPVVTAPAQKPEAPATNPVMLYAENCARCHGGTGVEGAGKAPRLDQPMGKDQIVSIINNGAGSMPRFAEKLSPVEVSAIADFVVSLQPKKITIV